MHANLRRNLRTVSTGCQNNLEGLSSEAASKYLSYFQAHQALLNYVTSIHDDGKGAAYNQKYNEITNHLIKCGASTGMASPVHTSSNTSSGYYSDRSLDSPLSLSGGMLVAASAAAEATNEELKLRKLELEKLKIEVGAFSFGFPFEIEILIPDLFIHFEQLKKKDEVIQTAERLAKLCDEKLKLQRSTFAELKEENEKQKNDLAVAKSELENQKSVVDLRERLFKLQKERLIEVEGELELKRSKINELNETIEVQKKKISAIELDKKRAKGELELKEVVAKEVVKENLDPQIPQKRRSVLELTNLYGGPGTLRRTALKGLNTIQ